MDDRGDIPSWSSSYPITVSLGMIVWGISTRASSGDQQHLSIPPSSVSATTYHLQTRLPPNNTANWQRSTKMSKIRGRSCKGIKTPAQIPKSAQARRLNFTTAFVANEKDTAPAESCTSLFLQPAGSTHVAASMQLGSFCGAISTSRGKRQK
ncbi:hypothetical protein BS17DRAFT_781496 [Gyrodon lividus]|nr:hypothetical protein BS17DRAFT_781496 [Gyrodon lividus]